MSVDTLIFFLNKVYVLQKNAIANPQVKVEFDGRKISGSARLIDDEDLARKISCIKYTEKNRQEEARIVLEVNLSNE